MLRPIRLLTRFALILSDTLRAAESLCQTKILKYIAFIYFDKKVYLLVSLKIDFVYQRAKNYQ